VDGRYRITPLAETILYPVTGHDKQQALRDAFFNVPLYKAIHDEFKGTRLPEALGLDNFLRTKFSIPPGDRTVLARRVLLDSAAQAGFFTATRGQRTHLTDPIIGSAFVSDSAPMPPLETGGDGGYGSGIGQPTGARVAVEDEQRGHVEPLLKRLLDEIPARGDPWPNRTDWEQLWKSTLDFLYGKPGGSE
jgi:hypothetical protein